MHLQNNLTSVKKRTFSKPIPMFNKDCSPNYCETVEFDEPLELCRNDSVATAFTPVYWYDPKNDPNKKAAWVIGTPAIVTLEVEWKLAIDPTTQRPFYYLATTHHLDAMDLQQISISLNIESCP